MANRNSLFIVVETKRNKKSNQIKAIGAPDPISTESLAPAQHYPLRYKAS